jgi:hypothetical protein
MSEYDPMWIGSDLDLFGSFTAQDEAATEAVPKERVPISGLNADEVANSVRERLQKVREQRGAKLLDDPRPAARALQYVAQLKQAKDTQLTKAKVQEIEGTIKTSDLEKESEKKSEKKSEKESKEKSKKKSKKRSNKKEKVNKSKHLRL